MRLSCWVTNGTNRQSEHLILITFHRQQWLRERVAIRPYSHFACLVTYKERYWFYVCRVYINCTALRHTCHSKAFILCTETGVAQSLQLLGYVLCNRGLRFRYICARIFSTLCPDRFCVPHSLLHISYGRLFPWGYSGWGLKLILTPSSV
jgi:hypothetical protein